MSDDIPALKPDIKKLDVILATWFGLGLIPKAPGTWGSLGAIPFAYLIAYTGGITLLIISTIIITLIGYWAADKFEKRTAIHDSKMVVIDEVAGQWLALWPALYFFNFHIIWVLIAFILFRAFDIIKPWPVSYFDRKIENAIGVMGDDIIAGLYAVIIITGAYYAGLG